MNPFYLDQFEVHSEQNLDKNAVLFYNEKSKSLNELKYIQLFEKSFLLSAYFIEQQIVDTPIVIIDGKTPSSYTIMLGTLFSGNYFSFLNPNHPAERIVSQVKNLGAVYIWISPQLTELKDRLVEQIPELQFIDLIEHKSAMPERRLSSVALKSKIAYAVSTSGTTGPAKTIKISHQNIDAYLKNISAILPLSKDDCILNISQLSFDVSIGEIFWSFYFGATLCSVNQYQFFLIPEIIKLSNASVWSSAPTLAKQLLKARPYAAEYFSSLKTISFCGEALETTLADSWKSIVQAARIFNLYGPAETTISIFSHEYTNESPVKNGLIPIGKIHNDQFSNIDDNGQLQLKGSQVYLSNSWYDTGDIVTKDESGCFHFLGRSDNQIKIAGMRFEIFEIENAIRLKFPERNFIVIPSYQDSEFHPDSTVLIWDANNEDDYLTCFEYLRLKIPLAFIPKSFIFISEFPMSPNGKIDRKLLQSKYQKRE